MEGCLHRLLKISDSQTLVGFLHSAWTHVDGNKQMTSVEVYTCARFFQKQVLICFRMKGLIWLYACSTAFGLGVTKPFFYCKEMKLIIDGVWNPANKNNLEVFSEISHRNSEISRSITGEESFLFCFPLNSNWAWQQLKFYIWF